MISGLTILSRSHLPWIWSPQEQDFAGGFRHPWLDSHLVVVVVLVEEDMPLPINFCNLDQYYIIQ